MGSWMGGREVLTGLVPKLKKTLPVGNLWHRDHGSQLDGVWSVSGGLAQIELNQLGANSTEWENSKPCTRWRKIENLRLESDFKLI